MAKVEAKQKMFREWALEQKAKYQAEKEAEKEANELKPRKTQSGSDYVNALDAQHNLFTLTPEQIAKVNEVNQLILFQRK